MTYIISLFDYLIVKLASRLIFYNLDPYQAIITNVCIIILLLIAVTLRSFLESWRIGWFRFL